MFSQALAMDLIGAPEFMVGVWLARRFQRFCPEWRRSGRTVLLAAAAFLLTGLAGTSLKLLLFGEPVPGFISFGFGFTILATPEDG